MLRSVYDIEADVKAVYYSDPSNPLLYERIKELATALLVYKKMCDNAEQVETIAHNLATDFFMKINEGKLEVECWTKYVWLRCYKFRELYFKDTKKQILSCKNLSEMEQIADLTSGSRFNNDDLHDVELEEALKTIGVIIDKTFKKMCRYREGTSEFTDLYNSVMLSLSEGSIIVFNLSEDYEPYIKFLVKTIIKKIRKSYGKYLVDWNCAYDEVGKYVTYYNQEV